jgi:hypothetical protein
VFKIPSSHILHGCHSLGYARFADNIVWAVLVGEETPLRKLKKLVNFNTCLGFFFQELHNARQNVNCTEKIRTSGGDQKPPILLKKEITQKS